MARKMTLTHCAVGCAAWLAIGAAALTGQSRVDRSVELTFGVYTSDKATVMYRKFTPVLEELANAMSRKLDRPVDVQLRIFKTYDQARDEFVEGGVDFVRFGPASYVLAKRSDPKVQLLAMESVAGRKSFPGLIVVRKSSPIRRLADLRGRKFAFGDRNSTIGRFLAQGTLLDANIRARDLASSDYLGRHDRVFRAVEVGDFDAGAVKENTFTKLNTDRQLRVLAKFDNVTKPWIARSGLPADVVVGLRKVLLDLTHPDALRALKVDGFLPTTDADYDTIRAAMRKAEQFEASRAARPGDPTPAPPGGRPQPKKTNPQPTPAKSRERNK